jgi:transcriptional regulator with XRE-family HTH domain
MPDDQVFGGRVKEIRKRRGLSQVELAQRLGVHQSLISQYECGYLACTAPCSSAWRRRSTRRPTEILVVKTAAAGTEDAARIDRRFLRRLKQVDKLSAHQKKILLATIDAFLAKAS